MNGDGSLQLVIQYLENRPHFKLENRFYFKFMSKITNYNSLKAFCVRWGAQLFGVCDVSAIRDSFALKPEVASVFNNAVSLGVRVNPSILDEIQAQPTKMYFHHYRALNIFLDQLGLRAANFIQSRDYQAIAIPASQIVDWQKQTGHLSHKNIGYLAGLGWIGRNNLLVNEQLGAQLRLVTLLTNMPLKADKPVKEDCGKCRACMVICPADAIKEKRENFNHLACFELLKGFQRQRIVDQYICGICVRACSRKGSKM